MPQPICPLAPTRPPGTVGLIGIGNMGMALLRRLRGLGWTTWIHDVDAQRCAQACALGAVLAGSAAGVAEGLVAAQAQEPATDLLPVVLIVVVVDAAQTREVLFGPSGAAPHLPPGSVLLLCPTLGPDDVVEIAHRLAQHGVHTLDAPMSGGPARAEDGSMSLMLAGPRFARHQLAPLLDAISSQQFHLGEQVGDAARTKLVNNLLAAINLAGAAEALALAQRLGLDGRQTLAVIEQSSGQSWIAQDRMRRALAGDLAPRAHTTLLAKDSALALAAAHNVGVMPALGQLAAQRFAQVCAQGGAQWDDACLFQFAGGQKETGAA